MRALTDWARRWWRWMVHPRPCAGQRWSVDGVGLVEILDSRWPRWADRVFGERGEVRFRVLGDERDLLWTVGDFRAQAVPWRPSAHALVQVDP